MLALFVCGNMHICVCMWTGDGYDDDDTSGDDLIEAAVLVVCLQHCRI